MAKIRINPDIIDNYGNNIKGQAGYVLQRAESVNHAAMNAPSYNGQFGPKVRAIGASAHSAGRQHSECLSNHGQKLNSIGGVFRRVDSLPLYGINGWMDRFIPPDTNAWFERYLRNQQKILQERLVKNYEKLDRLRKVESWYTRQIESLLATIAKYNPMAAYFLRRLIEKGDLAALARYIKALSGDNNPRKNAIFWIYPPMGSGIPNWMLNALFQKVKNRERVRNDIKETKRQINEDKKFLETINQILKGEGLKLPPDLFPSPIKPVGPDDGGIILPPGIIVPPNKPNPLPPIEPPVPAPRPMPQPVPTPPIPAPQPTPTPEPALPPGVLPNTPQANAVTEPQAKIEAGYGSQVASINSANPYPRGPNGQLHNCTWYAWQAVHDASGGQIKLPKWGDMETWIQNANNMLSIPNSPVNSVNTDPQPGSIISLQQYGGHVVFVEQVDRDAAGNITRIVVSEENWENTNYAEKWGGEKEPYFYTRINIGDNAGGKLERGRFNLPVSELGEGKGMSINFNYPA